MNLLLFPMRIPAIHIALLFSFASWASWRLPYFSWAGQNSGNESSLQVPAVLVKCSFWAVKLVKNVFASAGFHLPDVFKAPSVCSMAQKALVKERYVSNRLLRTFFSLPNANALLIVEPSWLLLQSKSLHNWHICGQPSRFKTVKYLRKRNVMGSMQTQTFLNKIIHFTKICLLWASYWNERSSISPWELLRHILHGCSLLLSENP